MAQRLTTRLRTAITKLIKAEEADAFKGCGNPGDYETLTPFPLSSTSKVTYANPL